MRAVFDDRAVLVRPGLPVGPYDPTNRFTYWVDRFTEGGDIAAPGPPQRYVQFIDVRDAATFMVRLLEDERSGIYDVTGPPNTITMEELAKTARETLKADEDFGMDRRRLSGGERHHRMDRLAAVDRPLDRMPRLHERQRRPRPYGWSFAQTTRTDDSRHARLVVYRRQSDIIELTGWNHART